MESIEIVPFWLRGTRLLRALSVSSRKGLLHLSSRRSVMGKSSSFGNPCGGSLFLWQVLLGYCGKSLLMVVNVLLVLSLQPAVVLATEWAWAYVRRNVLLEYRGFASLFHFWVCVCAPSLGISEDWPKCRHLEKFHRKWLRVVWSPFSPKVISFLFLLGDLVSCAKALLGSFFTLLQSSCCS